MLQAFAELIKAFFVPGSLFFLLLGLTAGVLLAYGPRRSRRLAIPALALLAIGYWLASFPVVSDALNTRFHSDEAHSVMLPDLSGAQAIVVLGAGATGYAAEGRTVTIPSQQTIFNALEAARVFQLLAGRLPVIASGGVGDPDTVKDPESVLLRDLLLRYGVPSEQITLESTSRTTHEQALLVAPLLKEGGWDRFVLVAPPVHMPRAVAVFTAQGVQPIPAVSQFQSDPPPVRTARWMPNEAALQASTRAAYDYLAWGYYWMRGWLTAQPERGLR